MEKSFIIIYLLIYKIKMMRLIIFKYGMKWMMIWC